MKLDGKQLRLSASDLANHLGCRYLTRLNREYAEGLRPKPNYFDPALKTLQERGFVHEAAYLGHLRAQGLAVLELPKDGSDIAASRARTLEAMHRGVDVIAQATMTSGRWLGYADVLRKVSKPSRFGDWSYEAHDTKLSRETKAGAVLQLALYSDILEEMQGARPECMWVVAPGTPFSFDSLRFEDFRAYYRWVRRFLEEATGEDGTDASTSMGANAPEPVPKCETCNWVRHCTAELRQVDHLSFVAGISRSQRRELTRHDVTTLAGLAQVPIPLPWKLERGSSEALTRVREQARIQLEGRTLRAPRWELLKPDADQGLARLPEPSPGDIFFDFEGDPFVDGGGLEYLFGFAFQHTGESPGYRAHWALNRLEEKLAFETFVDEVMERWARYPQMHIYHFAPYEPAAMRRLMGRHGSREQEVDRMLRGGLFVDLFTVVRQGVRASVESYSIKALEPFFGFIREVPLEDVGHSKRALEAALELAEPGTPPEIDTDWKRVVETYNRDDCISAMKLRDWLESLRSQLIAGGGSVARPRAAAAEPKQELKEKELLAQQLRERLLTNVPVDPTARSPEEHALALMAALIEFHRREDRVSYWEKYRLQDLSEEELREEPCALFGLELVSQVGGKTAPVHRYSYPPQAFEADKRADVYLPEAPKDENRLGTVEDVDKGACIIDIKKTKKTANIHPAAVYFHQIIKTDILAAALFRLGEWIAEHGVDVAGDYRAARDLLLGRAPRLRASGRGLQRASGETPVEHAKRLGLELDQGVLPIQGPPGAGKTFTGARMILALVAAGKRVGITANSHKVVRNLLDEVRSAAQQARMQIQCAQKITEKPDPESPMKELNDNAKALEGLRSGEYQVLGGVPWLWAREEAMSIVDVLFIDEAGQLSLANALAVAGSASSLVLLGDPRQLEQPTKGTHPEGAEVSALEHLLGNHLTVHEDEGLFLAETWRLHPAIADFTSLAFYERRLHPRPGLERLAIHAPPLIAPGLWYHPVIHSGNSTTAPEEVASVAGLVAELLRPGKTWVDADGEKHPVTRDDILIVAPYNAQVTELSTKLGGMRVGTVDKFQGQEAAVVIISMTSSSVEETPRGMEFLFSPNRLNVATSRAKCACVLVASPRLFEVECRTPKQMKLANALCQYREMARELPSQ